MKTRSDPTVNALSMPLRIPKSMLAKVDRYVVRLQKEMPGLGITRSDAIRVLLERALTKEKSK